MPKYEKSTFLILHIFVVTHGVQVTMGVTPPPPVVKDTAEVA